MICPFVSWWHTILSYLAICQLDFFAFYFFATDFGVFPATKPDTHNWKFSEQRSQTNDRTNERIWLKPLLHSLMLLLCSTAPFVCGLYLCEVTGFCLWRCYYFVNCMFVCPSILIQYCRARAYFKRQDQVRKLLFSV